MKKEVLTANPNHPQNAGISDPSQMYFEKDRSEDAESVMTKVFIGKVPIMLRSTYCILSGLGDKDLHELNECPYDQVRKRFSLDHH
jgi:DNA-directed RNA polymerase II subunit RPB2